jgi:hypothetical protein
MYHFELHSVQTSEDVALANSGGLLKDSSPTCILCREQILFGGGYVIVAEDAHMVSCQKCLGLALEGIVV